jgi:hypothetical protein
MKQFKPICKAAWWTIPNNCIDPLETPPETPSPGAGQMDSRENLISRMRKRFSASTVKGMLMVGAFLGVGALPCPDCGAPMIFHVWPIAGVLVVAQIFRKRKRGAQKPPDPIIHPPPVD